ncbi:hypothetical protein niasHT_022955 [Heterodera trifolii]|uniref:Uncharacterized protein n=1 Tax=Heterodera trifolii TaxID=157864 RepID=A0ABD2KIZ9_9BILA
MKQKLTDPPRAPAQTEEEKEVQPTEKESHDQQRAEKPRQAEESVAKPSRKQPEEAWSFWRAMKGESMKGRKKATNRLQLMQELLFKRPNAPKIYNPKFIGHFCRFSPRPSSL